MRIMALLRSFRPVGAAVAVGFLSHCSVVCPPCFVHRLIYIGSYSWLVCECTRNTASSASAARAGRQRHRGIALGTHLVCIFREASSPTAWLLHSNNYELGHPDSRSVTFLSISSSFTTDSDPLQVLATFVIKTYR